MSGTPQRVYSEHVARALRVDPEILAVAPESGSRSLRTLIAERYALGYENVLVGPGTASLIHGMIVRAALRGGTILHSVPSFRLYSDVAEAYGVVAMTTPLRNYEHDLQTMRTTVKVDTRLVLLDSPHNVTGTSLDFEEVVDFAKTLPAGCAVILDNVYGEYADNCDQVRTLLSSDQILVCRSFSKIFGLFGLRVGYVMGSASLLRSHGPVVLQYDVNVLGQRAAAAALGDSQTVEQNRKSAQAARLMVYDQLPTNGFPFVRSQSNAVLVNAGTKCAELADAAQSHGCRVRGPAEHGISGHLQVMLEDCAEATRFINALLDLGVNAT